MAAIYSPKHIIQAVQSTVKLAGNKRLCVGEEPREVYNIKLSKKILKDTLKLWLQKFS
jgi:hypothetical protein